MLTVSQASIMLLFMLKCRKRPDGGLPWPRDTGKGDLALHAMNVTSEMDGGGSWLCGY
ncbi:hypothetical protein DSTSK_34110 [Desulforhabdus sp. TSK]|nr:hypothetical protein DSTSK_34110 [Desulforhabdus sp. TSK]